MAISRVLPRAAVSAVLVSLIISNLAVAQHHDHGAMSESAEAESWRMPPMDMSMPMLPGLHSAVPVVDPMLVGSGVDLMSLPAAKPSEVWQVADGDTVGIHAMLVRREINGRMFAMLGYNGMYPGPMLRSTRGARINVLFQNHIEMPTTVHWHGIRIDNPFDGVPGVTQNPVRTGEEFLYEIKLPDSGIYWYHPHIREDVQQDLGLYGNLLVDDLNEEYYNPVNKEEVLILDDLLIDEAGLIPFGEQAPTHALMGRFGNVMLVNGVPDYQIDAKKGDVVRYYLTNVANSRTFNVTFGSGRAKIVASDVSRYEREVFVESVPIGPAERYVVEVHYDQSGPTVISNTIQAINHFRGEFYPHVDTLATVVVADTPSAESFAESFAELRSNEAVQDDIHGFASEFDRPVDKELELTLRVKNLPLAIMQSMEIDTLYVPPMEWNDAMPMMNWLSTGEQVTWILRDVASGKENMDIDWEFGVGDVMKLRLFNNPRTFHPMNHPFHIHGQRFLVVAIDGHPVDNKVWKDTTIIPVGSTVDLLVEMSNPGTWMMHCHIAEHLHAGMMLGFEVAETP